MSDWTSNAKPPLPLPCEHNETGLCPACVLKFAQHATLVADGHLKGVADSAIEVMRKLQWERNEAQAQNERYQKSIAITDTNFRRLQGSADRMRLALADISMRLDCDTPCAPTYTACADCGRKEERWCAGCVAREALRAATE